MSGDPEQMTEEEIIKWQEELYELESSAMAGRPVTPEEQMEIIKDYLADDYFEKLEAKVEAKKRHEAEKKKSR